ncbi:uncharacterized protein LOC131145057 isoform X2 [Malania oleifera]|uniref:uncharacterized protein LOC131145057 isoform X2 n=1 Tax=Malania oleifera TaxID=397392 RepID=UPI0025AE01C9|nr:uncharacterized protein LOC131145057 isoform X2 [Malania oleifera]
MAFLDTISLHGPTFLSKPRSLPPINRSSLPFINPRKPLQVVTCTSPKTLLTTEQEFLKAVSESEDKSLPCVRSYENDLARLTLVGAVDFEQALTAAAADGGEAAAEHIDADMPAMVVETVFPGPSDEHSTVSTRLFLPARKVKERAKKLKSSLTDDILSSTTSRNILAMTFRQVVLQQLWNFELMLFRPGTERNIEDLENPREVSIYFSLSSSDERVIAQIAEVVCVFALESTKRNFYDIPLGQASINVFHWLNKPKRIVSKDSSVVLYKLFEDVVVKNMQSLLDSFNSIKANYKPLETKPKYFWWTSSEYSKLEKIGGPKFSNWASEYVPAYMLQIDADKIKHVKFEGWKKSAENRWEVILTHYQMVGLANILDIFYEDVYTLPDKEFSCDMVAKFTNFSKGKVLERFKRSSSLLKMLSVIFASGIFLLAINVLCQHCLPHLHRGRSSLREPTLFVSSEIDSPRFQSLEATELEVFCVSIVKKIKDALGWPGDIRTDINVGAWIGEVPIYLRVSESGFCSEDILTGSTSLEKSKADMKATAQDIASYQVVLSTNGRIVGFQPTSRVAVNHWAANPLSKELYGGRKLSPGFIETGLKTQCPKEVIVIELLISINPDARFALARPAQ